MIPQDFNIFLNHNEIIQNLNINTLSAGKTLLLHRHQELNNVVASSSSTSDEADEKKQRRMMSNRESARKSRMKKKRHMDELTSLVVRLRTQNNDLVQRLKHVTESHDRILQENAKLREEASHLRQMLESSFALALNMDFVEPPCSFIDSNVVVLDFLRFNLQQNFRRRR